MSTDILTADMLLQLQPAHCKYGGEVRLQRTSVLNKSVITIRDTHLCRVDKDIQYDHVWGGYD